MGNICQKQQTVKYLWDFFFFYNLGCYHFLFEGSIIWNHQTHIAQRNLFLQLHNRTFYYLECFIHTGVSVCVHTCE